jgi:hypothetical protein
MTPRSIRLLPAVLVGILVVAPSVTAQAPTKLEQIPVFSGATRNADREAEEMSPTEAPGVYGDRALLSSAVRVFHVAAALEDVARFYQQRLAAREIPPDADFDQADPENVAVGRVSPVLCAFEPVDMSGADDPAALRAAYAKARQPFRAGQWLDGMDCRWTSRESATDYTELSVELQDLEAFEITTPEYYNETEIIIWVRTWGAPGAVAEEEEPPPVTPMAAPTEAQLGVPLYPGARFDGAISAGMSAGDDTGVYYVFGSADPVAKVAAFYEQRTGKKGMANEAGVLIVVQGEGLFPDLGVTIQPNAGTFPANVKSMITVRRRR